MAKVDLSENEFFAKFVGPDHVDSNDVQFWYQLLSCSFNFTRVQDPKTVDNTLNPYIDLLALNNSRTLNLGSLVRVTLDRVSRIKSKGGRTTNPYYVFQSFNSLYLIRTICKNFIENSSEDVLIQAFRAKVETTQQVQQKQASPVAPPQHLHKQQAPMNDHQTRSIPGPMDNQANVPTANDASDPAVGQEAQALSKEIEVTSGQIMLDYFISTLIEIIVDIPLNDSTYPLQIEAINSLLVLLSIQMYSNNQAGQFYIYRTLMQKKCSIHALILTKTLLNNFIRQDPMPQENGSIILGLASGIWNLLTLSYGQEEEEEEDSMPHLARQSLVLLNVLTNHNIAGKNPYREAIIHCQDSKFNLSDPQAALTIINNDALATASTSQSILASNNIKIEFGQLFEAICTHLQNDQVALLLYLLLHSNKIFKPYILTTTADKLDQLVLPLLKILYSNIQKGSHHVYMVLIIFVILSEEAQFSESIHKITLKGIPWFKDRVLHEVSLGSFTMLIVIRSFQYNTLRVKDKFLHTNLFATLVNLSNYVQRLHPYVCQRLLNLLERLTKRYLTIKPLSNSEQTVQTFTKMDVFNGNHLLAKALATDTQKNEYTQDASAIELDPSTAIKQNETTTSGLQQQNGLNAIHISATNQQQQPTTNNGTSNIVHLNELNDREVATSSGQQSPNSSNQSEHVNIKIDDSGTDLAWVEEVIRMTLEVINNLLDSQLDQNPDLVYTMLYKRNVFSSLLASHQSFYNMVINVERILTFFYNKVESYQRQLAVEEIKELIQSSSKEWSASQPPKDPNSQMLFRYVEDDQPEYFFIPYMWTKIYYSSGIVWNPKRIVLFNPEIA